VTSVVRDMLMRRRSRAGVPSPAGQPPDPRRDPGPRRPLLLALSAGCCRPLDPARHQPARCPAVSRHAAPPVRA